MQPGYLRELLPDSAPTHPESLQDVLNGESLNYLYLLLQFDFDCPVLLFSTCVEIIRKVRVHLVCDSIFSFEFIFNFSLF